jgi:hypothetical protein
MGDIIYKTQNNHNQIDNVKKQEQEKNGNARVL